MIINLIALYALIAFGLFAWAVYKDSEFNAAAIFGLMWPFNAAAWVYDWFQQRR